MVVSIASAQWEPGPFVAPREMASPERQLRDVQVCFAALLLAPLGLGLEADTPDLSQTKTFVTPKRDPGRHDPRGPLAGD